MVINIQITKNLVNTVQIYYNIYYNEYWIYITLHIITIKQSFLLKDKEIYKQFHHILKYSYTFYRKKKWP